jgi:periplasmic divalent cation tolerance protein
MSEPVRPSVVLVLTTFGASTDVAPIARTLVQERLAACVNILPVMTSIYRWKGSLEEDREQQVLIKTTNDRVQALEGRLRQLHPYDVPEFIVVPACGGSAAYLGWVVESVSGSPA